MELIGIQIFGIILLMYLFIVGVSLAIPLGYSSSKVISEKMLAKYFANHSQLTILLSIIFGTLVALAWSIFIYIGWEILKEKSHSSIVNTVVMAVLSFSLIVGGFSVVRKWKIANFIFLGSTIILMFAAIFSITQMRIIGHQYILSMLVFLIGFLNLVLFGFGKITWYTDQEKS